MRFTFDWSSGHFPLWKEILADLQERDLSILEIGSFEGRSAAFFLDFLRMSKITCLDLFEAGFETTFDANLANYGARVEKLKGPSARSLTSLIDARRIFDLVYIDGSHFRDDVMIDSLLAWQMTKPGTFFIWDDYRLNRWRPDTHRPKPAIDAFLRFHRLELDVLHRGYQIAARRVPQKTEWSPRRMVRWIRGEAGKTPKDWRGGV